MDAKVLSPIGRPLKGGIVMAAIYTKIKEESVS
jgi:hypothetical protein